MYYDDRDNCIDGASLRQLLVDEGTLTPAPPYDRWSFPQHDQPTLRLDHVGKLTAARELWSHELGAARKLMRDRPASVAPWLLRELDKLEATEGHKRWRPESHERRGADARL